jgi:hypothetical protein
MVQVCPNCGKNIELPGGKLGQEVRCSDCGAVVMASPFRWLGRKRSKNADSYPSESQESKRLKRVFEPIPRSVSITVGILLALGLLAPFWLYLVNDVFREKPIFMTDDAETLTVPPPPTNSLPAIVSGKEPSNRSTALDNYQGVWLGVGRDDLQGRFTLTAVNARGMNPEIYQARGSGPVSLLTAHFYDNSLREFSVVLREQKLCPDAIVDQLREMFGEPVEIGEVPPEKPVLAGINLIGSNGAGDSADDWQRKVAGFNERRWIAWTDKENRAEATIYYLTTGTNQCLSLVRVRVSASKWLAGQKPSVTGSVAPPPPSPPATNNVPPPRPAFPEPKL